MLLIRYYTLKVVKGYPYFGYRESLKAIRWKIICSSHFFRNWLFLKLNAILRSVNTVAHFWAWHSDSGIPLVVSVQEILYRGGHFDHTYTVWLYETFVVHHYYRKLQFNERNFSLVATRGETRVSTTQFCAVMILDLIKPNIQKCPGVDICWHSNALNLTKPVIQDS